MPETEVGSEEWMAERRRQRNRILDPIRAEAGMPRSDDHPGDWRLEPGDYSESDVMWCYIEKLERELVVQHRVQDLVSDCCRK